MSTAKRGWLACMVALAACRAHAPLLDGSGARTHQLPDACARADASRDRAESLVAEGRIERAARVLVRAEELCPARAGASWPLLLATLDELGQDAEATSLAARIEAAGAPEDAVRAARAYRGKRRDATAKSGEALLREALAAKATGDARGARRLFDRALVALERERGERARPDLLRIAPQWAEQLRDQGIAWPPFLPDGSGYLDVVFSAANPGAWLGKFAIDRPHGRVRLERLVPLESPVVQAFFGPRATVALDRHGAVDLVDLGTGTKHTIERARGAVFDAAGERVAVATVAPGARFSDPSYGVRVVRVSTGEEIARVDSPAAEPLQFVAGDRYLLAAAETSVLRVDTTTGAVSELPDLRTPEVSRSGRLVAGFGTSPASLRVFDVASGKLDSEATVDPPDDNRRSIAFRPDERVVVAFSHAQGGRDALLLDRRTRRALRARELLNHETAPISAIAFTADGKHVCAALANSRRAHCLLDAASGRFLEPNLLDFVTPRGAVRVPWDGHKGVTDARRVIWSASALDAADAALSPDGSTIALVEGALGAGAPDLKLLLLDRASMKVLHTVPLAGSDLQRIDFGPDGRVLRAETGSAEVLIEAASGRVLPSIEGSPPLLCPDGRVVGLPPALFDAVTGKGLQGEGPAVEQPRVWLGPRGLVEVEANGTTLVTDLAATTATVGAPPGARARTPRRVLGRILTYSEDGRFAVVDRAGSMRAVDLESDRQGPEIAVPRQGLAIDGRGKWMIVADGDTTLKHFDPWSGRELRSHRLVLDAVLSALSSDGAIAVVNDGAEDRVMDVATGRASWTTAEKVIAPSLAGRFTVTTRQVRDRSTGRVVLDLGYDHGGASAAGASPDGSVIVLAVQKELRVVDTQSGMVTDVALLDQYARQVVVAPGGKSVMLRFGYDQLAVHALGPALGRRPLVDIFPAPSGALVGIFDDGRVEVTGDPDPAITASLVCRIGGAVLPFDLCAERSLAPGSIARALDGDGAPPEP